MGLWKFLAERGLGEMERQSLIRATQTKDCVESRLRRITIAYVLNCRRKEEDEYYLCILPCLVQFHRLIVVRFGALHSWVGVGDPSQISFWFPIYLSRLVAKRKSRFQLLDVFEKSRIRPLQRHMRKKERNSFG